MSCLDVQAEDGLENFHYHVDGEIEQDEFYKILADWQNTGGGYQRYIGETYEIRFDDCEEQISLLASVASYGFTQSLYETTDSSLTYGGYLYFGGTSLLSSPVAGTVYHVKIVMPPVTNYVNNKKFSQFEIVFNSFAQNHNSATNLVGWDFQPKSGGSLSGTNMITCVAYDKSNGILETVNNALGSISTSSNLAFSGYAYTFNVGVPKAGSSYEFDFTSYSDYASCLLYFDMAVASSTSTTWTFFGETAGSLYYNWTTNIYVSGSSLSSVEKEQLGFFDKMLAWITGFFDNLVSSVVDALTSLFLPRDGFFEEWFNSLNDFLSEKLGLLYAPIDIFVSVLQAIADADGSFSGIPFPEIEWDGTVLVSAQTVEFPEGFDELRNKIYFVTDVMMIGAVLWLFERKLSEVLHR